MDDVLNVLEGSYGMPVVDETGLTGRYAINIEWTPGSKDSLSAVLKDKLGMSLVPASRVIDVVEAVPLDAV